MILSKKKLFHMAVRTRSGIFLGRVADITFDTHSGNVLQYHVRMFRGMARIFPFLFKSRTLFISHTQIIRWEEREIIVEDSMARAYHAVEYVGIPAQKNSPVTSCSSTDRAAPS